MTARKYSSQTLQVFTDNGTSENSVAIVGSQDTDNIQTEKQRKWKEEWIEKWKPEQDF